MHCTSLTIKFWFLGLCVLFLKIPAAPTVINDNFPSPVYKWWVKQLGLQESEKLILESGQQLSDLHIQAATTMFNKQFPDLPKLQPSISFQKPQKVSKTSLMHIQNFKYIILETIGWCHI